MGSLHKDDMGTEVTSLLIEVNTNHVDNLIEHGTDFSSSGVGPFGDIYRRKTGIYMYILDNRYSPHKCNVWKEQVSCLIPVISLFFFLAFAGPSRNCRRAALRVRDLNVKDKYRILIICPESRTPLYVALLISGALVSTFHLST